MFSVHENNILDLKIQIISLYNLYYNIYENKRIYHTGTNWIS
jgi:hypothetical protein